MNRDSALDLACDNLPPRGLTRRVGFDAAWSLYCRLGPDDGDLRLFLGFAGIGIVRDVRARLRELVRRRPEAFTTGREGKDRR
jgi:hypothetical protein